MQTNIEARVKTALATYARIGAHEIKNEMSLVGDLGYDSLDAVDTLMDVEDEFGIEISDEDAEKITTVQQVIDYVTAKVAA